MGNRKITIQCIFYILLVAFVLSLIPIIWLGFFSFPQADDYSYGAAVYHVVSKGGTFGSILMSAAKQVVYSYQKWQGTFSAIFLMALQPAVFGEQYYVLTTVLMLSSLIVGNVLLIETICGCILEIDKYTVGIISVVLCELCIQFVPYPTDSFFWYNGSLYYTFFHSLFLISVALLIREGKERNTLRYVFLCFLSIMIGGGNYVTALTYAIVSFSIIIYLTKVPNWKRLILPQILFFTAFSLNIIAPGNSVRQSSINYTPDALHAILSSFEWGAKDSIHWFSFPMAAALLFLFPLIWRTLPIDRVRFRYPGLFTFYSYCILSSMYCAPYYAMDGVAGRTLNIIFYTYVLLLVLNGVYWIGWIKQKMNSPEVESNRVIPLRHLLFTTSIFIISVLFYIQVGSLTSVLALHDLRSGEAFGYHETMLKRLVILHDRSQRDIIFEPCPYHPYLIGRDLGDNRNNWVNRDMADYYEKDSIFVKDN